MTTSLRRTGGGHDVLATRGAFALLRGTGFKIHRALDAEPPGRDPGTGRGGLPPGCSTIRAFRPDELKIYPCALIETAELMRSYRDGYLAALSRR